jgi:CRISPR-associated endonuclease Cas1
MQLQSNATKPARHRELERDHQTQRSPLRARRGVYVVEGYGVRVFTRSGRLHVEDGFGRERRGQVFSRTRPDLSRLVLLGHAGTLTLEALRWLSDLGISYLHLDADGRVLATSVPGDGDARLRRSQALAASSSVGLEIARHLLSEKLRGQREVLLTLKPDESLVAPFDAALLGLGDAADINELVAAERDAALAYWTGWREVGIRFRGSDAGNCPEHWRTFGRRMSPLTGAPRLAVNPINALLNYLYTLLEAETRIACLTVGLDPTLGIVHADYRSRDSLALDLMEAVRPRVDAYVLELLGQRTFAKGDFFETRRGVCRIVSPLTRELAETLPAWAEFVAPVCERVAKTLAEAPGSKVERLSTPLTRSNYTDARDPVRRRPPRAQLRPELPEKVCKRCGGELPRSDRVYCDECLPEVRRNQRTKRRCKRCGGVVPGNKRVYCDACYSQLDFCTKKRCKRCGGRLPHRKRVYCDRCLPLRSRV